MASAVEHGRVPPHQSYRDSAEELARWLSVVTALLSLSLKSRNFRSESSIFCLFFGNIAKGTTDPRVEFLSQVL